MCVHADIERISKSQLFQPTLPDPVEKRMFVQIRVVNKTKNNPGLYNLANTEYRIANLVTVKAAAANNPVEAENHFFPRR